MILHNCKDNFLEYLEYEIYLAKINKEPIKEEVLTNVLEKYESFNDINLVNNDNSITYSTTIDYKGLKTKDGTLLEVAFNKHTSINNSLINKYVTSYTVEIKSDYFRAAGWSFKGFDKSIELPLEDLINLWERFVENCGCYGDEKVKEQFEFYLTRDDSWKINGIRFTEGVKFKRGLKIT